MSDKFVFNGEQSNLSDKFVFNGEQNNLSDKFVFNGVQNNLSDKFVFKGQIFFAYFSISLGDIPAGVKARYSSDSSITVFRLTSQDGGPAHWEVMRPSGVKLLEGRGTLPEGVIGFVRGRLQLPQVPHGFNVSICGFSVFF